MNIKVPANTSHNVYGSFGMSGKLKHGLEKLGHTIVQGGKWESKEDLIVVFGSAANLKDYAGSDAKKIFISHGVHWFKGFDVPENQTLRDNFENCDAIMYQSEFAKHMTQKAFGVKDGEIYLNAGIPDFPAIPQIWKEGDEIKIAVCAVWRAWKRLHECERLVREIAMKGYKIRMYVVGRAPEDTGLYDLPLKGDNYEIEYLGMMNHDSMKALYHQCHMFWQLSFNDYSPATCLEAQAWGLPVIGVNSGGVPDEIGPVKSIVDSDPFIDSPMNIHREDLLPQIDTKKFFVMFDEIIRHLPYYQTQIKKWVEEEANCTTQVEKVLKLYERL